MKKTLILAIVILLAAGTGFFWYRNHQSAEPELNNESTANYSTGGIVTSVANGIIYFKNSAGKEYTARVREQTKYGFLYTNTVPFGTAQATLNDVDTDEDVVVYSHMKPEGEFTPYKIDIVKSRKP